MHELSIAQNILEAAGTHVADDRRLTKVVVEFGVLTGIVRESLDYCFSAVARHMGFADAELEVRLVPAAATCPS